MCWVETAFDPFIPNKSFNHGFFFLIRRQKELEQKSIEDAANKRIEELVAQRVAEELERRRDEIEAEVLRRVEEAKKVMEAEMLQEMERRKQEQLEEAKRREVGLIFLCLAFSLSLTAIKSYQQRKKDDMLMRAIIAKALFSE